MVQILLSEAILIAPLYFFLNLFGSSTQKLIVVGGMLAILAHVIYFSLTHDDRS